MRSILEKPHLIIVSALMTVVLGGFAYTRIPADLLPQFDTPAVQIVCFYPGMPPEVMEKDIMSRLQRWTAQSVGIEHQEAKAMQGVCVVKDFFTEDKTMAEAMAQVSSYAMSDMFYLPPGTIPPMVMPFDPTASVPLCLVVVSNPVMNEQELYDIAYYELRNKLQSIRGVIAPAVYGGKLRRILAYVDAEKLEAYGLSLMDVQNSLRKQNVLIPAGSIKIGQQDLQIFTNAIPEKIDELNNTPLRVINGVPVLMRDVGEVKNASQIQSNIVRINGSRQVYIPIYRQPGANTIEIVDRINTQLATILTRLKNERSEDPKMKSLVLSVAMDQSTGVRESIQSLQLAGCLGAFLAGIVVLVFLRSIRLTLIVLLAIPLAIIAAFLVMFFTGDSINAMTLGGLALAIGILVDQSIVVLENIVRHARMRKTPMEAAIDGTSEVLGPILVSTLTFVVVFLPVIFLSGLTRFLFAPLAVAAVVAIAASFILSITLVPAYCAYFFPASQADASSNENSTAWFGELLGKVIAARWLVVALAIALFVGAIFVTQRQGRELFPAVDSGQITMYVRMPSGTRIEQTEEVIKQIEQKITELTGEADPAYALDPTAEQHPDSALQLLISNIGVLMDWPAAYTPNNGPMDAFMLLQLKNKPSTETAESYVSQLRESLAAEFPEVEISYDTGGMLTAALNMGEPAPIHFQVRCSDLQKAQDIAGIIRDTASEIPGATDVRIAQRIDYPALEVNMDRELAARMDVTPDDVMKNLVAATNSTINFEPTFWIDKNKGNHYFFGVQYREEDLNSEQTLNDISVMSNGGQSVRRLGSVATISRSQGPAVVHHRNISRVTDVYAGVLPGFDVGSVVSAIESKLAADERLGVQLMEDDRGPYALLNAEPFAGNSYRMMGEVKLMRESFAQLTVGLVIAAILVYLVMVVQFRSFRDPLIVLLTVPLGYIGVIGLLWATDTPLSVPALMGIVMMVGIVVEYSIVLVDFANRRLADGLSVQAAVVDAASVRLRPILMTSLTTWLALMPMAIGLGGSGTNAPLARAIVGGVVGATLLSLIVVPCLYVMMKRKPTTETLEPQPAA